MMIIDRLIANIDEKQCPIVVGLDPALELIPEFLCKQAENVYGNTLRGASEALYLFNSELLHTLCSVIPAVKLQMACYELYGKWGIDAFDRTVDLAKKLGLLVINDSKRNDIGNTASFYAKGHLGKVPLFDGHDDVDKADFLTINPYMGDDTIEPFVTECINYNKGLFILARTSNKSAGQYQQALVDGIPLYQKIARDIQQLSTNHLGIRGFSPFGAVVGATWPEEARQLRDDMPNVFILMPGYGAQGGTADQVTEAFNTDGYGAVVNSSRGIIFAYRLPDYQERFPYEEEFTQASFQAISSMREDLLRTLKQAGRLPKNW